VSAPHVSIEGVEVREVPNGTPDICCECHRCSATLTWGTPVDLEELLETAALFLARHAKCPPSDEPREGGSDGQ
jgi:hypothetical protein